MMLVLQIAGGIVLAFIVIRFWAEILLLGVWLLVAVVVIGALVFGGAYASKNPGIWLIIGLAVGAGLFHAGALYAQEKHKFPIEDSWSFALSGVIILPLAVVFFWLAVFDIINSAESASHNSIGAGIFLALTVLWGYVLRARIRNWRLRHTSPSGLTTS